MENLSKILALLIDQQSIKYKKENLIEPLSRYQTLFGVFFKQFCKYFTTFLVHSRCY